MKKNMVIYTCIIYIFVCAVHVSVPTPCSVINNTEVNNGVVPFKKDTYLKRSGV